MSPGEPLSFPERVLSQLFQYDWLGNQTATDDDSHGFYDRSLGTVTNNTASQKPYQLAGAEQTTGTKTGALATKYDDAGNLVAMAVRRDGSCFPEGAVCSQQYRYEWDEVGRLVEAKRWDVQGPSLDSEPVGQAAAHLRYGYDASDNRVIKTATGDQGEQVHTVYIFGSLELRRAQFDAVESPDDYTDDIDTEVGYLFAHGVRLARLHWDDNGSPAVGGANLHVLFELGDHLGSSSKVLDKSTSELVEASTYMGYGQAESDYRPGRWKSFREDYRFTGKEEDAEVGLIYFGKRFLSSALGRWVSADPLTVHGNGADANGYAYVKAKILRSIDLVGFDETGAGGSAREDTHGGSRGMDSGSGPAVGTMLTPLQSLLTEGGGDLPIVPEDPSPLDHNLKDGESVNSAELIVCGPYAGHGYGHTALSVTTKTPSEQDSQEPNEQNVVYDFGRYKRISGDFGESGDGILRVWQNAKKEFLDYDAKHRRDVDGYEAKTTPLESAFVTHYMNRKISKATIVEPSTEPIEQGAQIATWYKLQEDYFATGPNCTTLSIDAFTYGGRGKHFDSSPMLRGLNGNERSAYHAIGSKAFRVFMPLDLQADLEEKAQAGEMTKHHYSSRPR